MYHPGAPSRALQHVPTLEHARKVPVTPERLADTPYLQNDDSLFQQLTQCRSMLYPSRRLTRPRRPYTLSRLSPSSTRTPLRTLSLITTSLLSVLRGRLIWYWRYWYIGRRRWRCSSNLRLWQGRLTSWLQSALHHST